MARIVDIVYSLKDKFTGQVRRIVAGYRDMEKAGDRAAENLDKSHRSIYGGIGNLVAKLKTAKAGIAGLFASIGVGSLTAGIKESAEAFDQIAKQADKVGVTTDALQELRYAANRTGVETGALDTAIQRFSRRLAEAGRGGGVLKKEFDRLGISVRDQNGALRSTEAVLRDYADALSATADPQEQLRLAFAAFDTEGAALVNTLRGGAKALEDYAQAARAAGLVVDEQLLRDAERINDRFDELSETISTKLKSAFVSLAGLVGFSGLTQQELQAAKTSQAIKDLQQQVGEYQTKIAELQQSNDPTAGAAIEQYQAAIARQLETIKALQQSIGEIPTDAPVAGMQKLREAIETATGAAKGLYSETAKLFKKKETDPFDGLESSAAQTLKTYRLIGDAISNLRVDPGSDKTAESVERAAQAINKLKANGEAAEVTLESMKKTLGDALQQPAEGVNQELKIVPQIDENGAIGFADEATVKLQQSLDGKNIIVKVSADTRDAEQAIADLQRRAQSLNLGVTFGAGDGVSISDQLLKRGTR